MQKPPKRILVRGDVYELVTNVATPPREMGIAKTALQEMLGVQSQWGSRAKAVIEALNQTGPTSDETSRKLELLLALPVLVSTKISGLLKLYQHDETSLELYRLEHARWELVYKLVKAAYNYSRDALPRGQAAEWLNVNSDITELRYDHSDDYRMLEPDRERYIRERGRYVQVDRFSKADLDQPTVPGRPANRPTSTAPTRAERLKLAIGWVVEAAGLIATATVKTIDHYDQAAKMVTDARQQIQLLSGPPTSTQAQVVWFSGAKYLKV